MARRLYYCDHHEIPLPQGHKFPVQKYRMLRERLALDRRFVFEPAPVISALDLALAHDGVYVRTFLEGMLDPMIMRKIGFPWSEGLVRRTLSSVGGTLAAARYALQTGLGGTLAGGTHHAFRSEGAGFCVFNDLAVTILTLQRDRAIERAAVIDLDVHQGDGTAAIFPESRTVFTLSVHGANNFPFRKQKSRVDVELPDGTKDAEYLAAVKSALPAAFDFAPDLILYQAGVDPLVGDRLGKLAVSAAGLMERDRLVFTAARERRIPLVITLGGGYHEVIERTVEAHVNTFRTAMTVYGPR